MRTILIFLCMVMSPLATAEIQAMPEPTREIEFKPKKPEWFNGCEGDGKIKLEYVGPDKKGGCDPMRKLNPEFAKQLNGKLCSCFEGSKHQASPGGCNVTLQHEGTTGDKRHLKKRSYHNEGLAIDVKAVVVNGKTYTYANQEDAAFFKNVRECWAMQVNHFGCGNGKEPHAGSVGNEDHDHQNHLHLSLPCKQLASNKKNAIVAGLEQIWPMAWAEKKSAKAPERQTSVQNKELKVDGGSVVLSVRDTQGEPVSTGIFVTAKLKCDGKKELVMADRLAMCGLDSSEIKDGALELAYRTSVNQDGTLNCMNKETKRFPVSCR